MTEANVVDGGSAISGATISNIRWSRADSVRTTISVAIVVALVVGAYVLQSNSEGDSTPAFSLLVGASLGIVFERGRFCFYCIFREAIEERVTRPLIAVISA